MFCWRNFFLIETRTHGLEKFQVQLEHNLWITPSSHCESPNAVFPVPPSVAIVIGTGNRICCCCYVSINQICQSTNSSSCMIPPPVWPALSTTAPQACSWCKCMSGICWTTFQAKDEIRISRDIVIQSCTFKTFNS